jgi:alginate O-acetyltransferase complex protein AlgI
MYFNSPEYLFAFLPIVLLVYFFLTGKHLLDAAKYWLVFASLFFYSWWNIIYLPLILCSMLFNYSIGSALIKNRLPSGISRKALLAFGIAGNLGLLTYFKYTDFFITHVNLLIKSEFELLFLALPLAISFFTFQQIVYLVDSYRNIAKEEKFLNYALFISFFPQLIAGPIVYHREMMPQFLSIKNKVVNWNNILIGVFLLFIGLFKKVVLADTFSIWSTRGFDELSVLTFFEGWATSLSYTFQIYFDFSGYIDMATGAALLFNIKLPINFNSPYKALNLRDFWRKWHMTFSRFLKEHLYIPLGGNRGAELKTFRNIMITFLLGGLWHGAGVQFIFWGFLHGLGLIIHHIWEKFNFRLHSILAWILTFNFINFTWIFFRAENWADAMKVLRGMSGLEGAVLPPRMVDLILDGMQGIIKPVGKLNIIESGSVVNLSELVLMLGIGFILVLFFKNTNQLEKRGLKIIFILIFAFTINSMFFSQVVSEFLYFRF